jgi:SAM-dependent methyltransferase
VKQYDRAYFDRWYRSAGRVKQPEVMRRKVRLALAAAEYLLQRPVRTVLDIGCGEALWRGELRRLRPGLRYTGVDSSEYAVRRFGKRRNIVLGSLADLDRLRLRGGYDLVVCADVLHYVPLAELRAGVASIRRLLGGMAYLEAFTTDDVFGGDVEAWKARPASLYQREFRRAGLVRCGLNCYLAQERAGLASALEQA